MPGGDGTGPAGLGPMTGRRAGYCAGYSMPGSANPALGGGWGRGGGQGFGRGRGRGWRRGYYPMGYFGAPPVTDVAPQYAPPSAEQEVQALRAQAGHVEGALNEIMRRITELEAARQKED